MEDVENRFLGQNRKHQARAGHKEREAVQHHLSGWASDAHSSGDISHRNHDADNAEALHGADETWHVPPFRHPSVTHKYVFGDKISCSG